eukprot:5553821-Amphidinium_carterae.1
MSRSWIHRFLTELGLRRKKLSAGTTSHTFSDAQYYMIRRPVSHSPMSDRGWAWKNQRPAFVGASRQIITVTLAACCQHGPILQQLIMQPAMQGQTNRVVPKFNCQYDYQSVTHTGNHWAKVDTRLLFVAQIEEYIEQRDGILHSWILILDSAPIHT